MPATKRRSFLVLTAQLSHKVSNPFGDLSLMRHFLRYSIILWCFPCPNRRKSTSVHPFPDIQTDVLYLREQLRRLLTVHCGSRRAVPAAFPHERCDHLCICLCSALICQILPCRHLLRIVLPELNADGAAFLNIAAFTTLSSNSINKTDFLISLF